MDRDKELAWAAGIFEGEGSISSNSEYKYPILKINMTDKDVLDRFKLAVNSGNVNGPYKGQGSKTPEHYKDLYSWQLGGITPVFKVIKEFWPFLSDRRKTRSAEVFAEYYLCEKRRLK